MSFGQVAIIGGGLAGLRAAETLREKGYAGGLTMFSAEAYPPYNRPPLSKQFLKKTTDEDALVFPIAGDLDLDIRLNSSVVRVDASSRKLWLTGKNQEISWDGLIIAAGATPISPRIEGLDREGVHFLKSLDDARHLRSALASAKRLVVIGGGFIGCEIAASARELGIDVNIVDLAETTMLRALGPHIGKLMARFHQDAGVKLIMGHAVTAIEGSGVVESVVLDDGKKLRADLVVVGVGSAPAVDFLKGSGLAIGNGVLCDTCCRVEGGGGRVVAAGDAANWPHLGYGGQRMRIEHWTQAAEQGIAAANALLSPDFEEPFSPVLSMWSDQYGKKLQSLGAPWLAENNEIVETDETNGQFFVRCWSGANLMGVVARGMPGKIIGHRQAIIDTMAQSERAQTEAKLA